jgi:hypothetical protein
MLPMQAENCVIAASQGSELLFHDYYHPTSLQDRKFAFHLKN